MGLINIESLKRQVLVSLSHELQNDYNISFTEIRNNLNAYFNREDNREISKYFNLELSNIENSIEKIRTEQEENNFDFDPDVQFGIEEIDNKDIDPNSIISLLVIQIYNKALEYVPKDTWNLAQSIKIEDNIVYVDLEQAPYGLYVHESTTWKHTNGTHSFLLRAAEEVISNYHNTRMYRDEEETYVDFTPIINDETLAIVLNKVEKRPSINENRKLIYENRRLYKKWKKLKQSEKDLPKSYKKFEESEWLKEQTIRNNIINKINAEFKREEANNK